jgi:hypothetical protein
VCSSDLLFFDASAEAQERPKLILQITVDQLRGDLPTRYYDRLGDDGFRMGFDNWSIPTYS